MSKIAVLIDVRDIALDTINKFTFNGIVMYKMNGKAKLLPFEQVTVSYMNSSWEICDVLASKKLGKLKLLFCSLEILLLISSECYMVLESSSSSKYTILSIVDY